MLRPVTPQLVGNTGLRAPAAGGRRNPERPGSTVPGMHLRARQRETLLADWHLLGEPRQTVRGLIVAACGQSLGEDWTKLERIEDESVVGNRCAAGGKPGYAVAGSTADGPAVFTSADGVQWSKAPDQAAFATATLVETADGFVALPSNQPPGYASSEVVGVLASDGRRVVVLSCGSSSCSVWTSQLAP
jgi:hypothetical protein